jgi:hypothetical protein
MNNIEFLWGDTTDRELSEKWKGMRRKYKDETLMGLATGFAFAGILVIMAPGIYIKKAFETVGIVLIACSLICLYLGRGTYLPQTKDWIEAMLGNLYADPGMWVQRKLLILELITMPLSLASTLTAVGLLAIWYRGAATGDELVWWIKMWSIMSMVLLGLSFKMWGRFFN